MLQGLTCPVCDAQVVALEGTLDALLQIVGQGISNPASLTMADLKIAIRAAAAATQATS